MARPLQFFGILAGFSAPSVHLNCLRSSSKISSKAWMSQIRVGPHRVRSQRSRFNDDGEPELEEMEDKLQAVLDKERNRQRSVKYDIVRRKMAPSGAPQRELTWAAIEQIRYLKQEQPEEWTVERLAEGFSVPSHVILRVLKSKFTPSKDRKAKQDAKAMAKLGQQVLPSGSRTKEKLLKFAANQTPAMLTSGRTEDALISVTAQTQMLQSKALKSTVTVEPPKLPTGICKDSTVTGSTIDDGGIRAKPEEAEEHEDSWDGQVLTEEELEELLDTDKPSPVVQMGNDYFDAEGNFLYRI